MKSTSTTIAKTATTAQTGPANNAWKSIPKTTGDSQPSLPSSAQSTASSTATATATFADFFKRISNTTTSANTSKKDSSTKNSNGSPNTNNSSGPDSKPSSQSRFAKTEGGGNEKVQTQSFSNQPSNNDFNQNTGGGHAGANAVANGSSYLNAARTGSTSNNGTTTNHNSIVSPQQNSSTNFLASDALNQADNSLSNFSTAGAAFDSVRSPLPSATTFLSVAQQSGGSKRNTTNSSTTTTTSIATTKDKKTDAGKNKNKGSEGSSTNTKDASHTTDDKATQELSGILGKLFPSAIAAKLQPSTHANSTPAAATKPTPSAGTVGTNKSQVTSNVFTHSTNSAGNDGLSAARHADPTNPKSPIKATEGGNHQTVNTHNNSNHFSNRSHTTDWSAAADDDNRSIAGVFDPASTRSIDVDSARFFGNGNSVYAPSAAAQRTAAVTKKTDDKSIVNGGGSSNKISEDSPITTQGNSHQQQNHHTILDHSAAPFVPNALNRNTTPSPVIMMATGGSPYPTGMPPPQHQSGGPYGHYVGGQQHQHYGQPHPQQPYPYPMGGVHEFSPMNGSPQMMVNRMIVPNHGQGMYAQQPPLFAPQNTPTHMVGGQHVPANGPVMIQLVGADGLPYQGSYRDLQPKQFRHHRATAPKPTTENGTAHHPQQRSEQEESGHHPKAGKTNDEEEDEREEGHVEGAAVAPKRRSRGGRKRGGQKQAFLNQDNTHAPAAPSFLRPTVDPTTQHTVAQNSTLEQGKLNSNQASNNNNQQPIENRSQSPFGQPIYHQQPSIFAPQQQQQQQHPMRNEQQRQFMSMTDSQTALVAASVVNSILAGEEGEEEHSSLNHHQNGKMSASNNNLRGKGSGALNNSGPSSKSNSGRQPGGSGRGIGGGNGNLSNTGNTSASDDLSNIVDDGRPIPPSRAVLKELAKACKPRPPWFVGVSNNKASPTTAESTPTSAAKNSSKISGGSPPSAQHTLPTPVDTTASPSKVGGGNVNTLDDELHLFASFISPTPKELARLEKMKAACEESFGKIWTAAAEAAAAEELLEEGNESAPITAKKKKIALMPMGMTAAGVKHPPGIAPSQYYAMGTQILYGDTEDEIRNVLLADHGYVCEFFMDSARDCSTVLITDPNANQNSSGAANEPSTVYSSANKQLHPHQQQSSNPNSSATTTPNPHAPAQIAVRYGPRATRCGPAATLLASHVANNSNNKSTMIVIDALLRQNNIIDAKGNDPSRVSSETVAVMFLSLVRAMEKGDFPSSPKATPPPQSSSFSVSATAGAQHLPAHHTPQQQPAVPSPSISASSLQISSSTHPLMAFFMYYGFPVNFDPSKQSVHPEGVLVSDGTTMTRPHKVHADAALSVLDPTDLKRNLSAKVTNVTHIAAILNYCYSAISQHEQVPVSKRRAQSSLSTIIGGEAYWGRILELYAQGIEPYHHVVSTKRKLLLRAMME